MRIYCNFFESEPTSFRVSKLNGFLFGSFSLRLREDTVFLSFLMNNLALFFNSLFPYRSQCVTICRDDHRFSVNNSCSLYLQEAYRFLAWNPKECKLIQPDLDYIAPELQLEGTASQACDMFTLGLVICSIYNDGHSLLESKKNLSLYVKKVEEVRNADQKRS